ncbi:Shugoshin-like 1, partial [Buceros rhinoceros silvestris]
ALGKDSASMNFSKLKNFEICPEKGHHEAPGAGKAEQNLDHVCKEAYQKTLTPGHGRTALQDLTNTGEQSQTALCKSPQTSEENSAAPSTRARATICYKEPSISSKLRRGDRFTDTQFLNSPVYKERNKRSFKSKSKF